ncbi:MAG: DNA-3-methyladenine glycosylase I [Nitriliruptor sp.]|uniref:DNA-3-methyladenine glycosylase I n=1 Tax=Nitriliruptor sp. TaxID=2448056 RepID=UPI0034A026DC
MPDLSEEPSGGLPDGLVRGEDGVLRCWWPGDDLEYRRYHDTEWGRPVHDDRRLFEKLCLEGFQAGLSWLTILRRRPALREVFADFDPERIAAFGPEDVDRLLGDARIIRHRGKVEATVHNARAYLDLVGEGTSLDDLVWRYTPEAPPIPRTRGDVRATSAEATVLAADLKRRGFRFVGPTTAYAFCQAMGLVDDHLVGCASRTPSTG